MAKQEKEFQVVKLFFSFFYHFKTSMLSLMKKPNITYEFTDIFLICTDQEKGITSAIKEISIILK